MATQNKFSRRTVVRLLMCDNPECGCGCKYTLGETAIVTNARGRHIEVKCTKDYQGLLARIVYFRKETAEKHLERVKP